MNTHFSKGFLFRLAIVFFCSVAASIVYADSSLEELLLQKGVISEKDLRTMQDGGMSLEELLLQKGIITQQEKGSLKSIPAPKKVAEEAIEEPARKKKLDQKITDKIAEKIEAEFPVKASYGDKGFHLETRDGNWATNLQWRAQMRFSHPYRSDPRQIKNFENADQSTFEMRRVRMKIGGHGFRPWLKYFFEVDLQPTRNADGDPEDAGVRLIDWRVSAEKYQWLSLRAGQWKVNYNRERVDSSGRQTFVERSIVNRLFTVDRQMGVMAYGRLFPETFADTRYFLGVFNGEGRGVANDDSDMMYMGRLQWNFLGRDLKFRQSDVEYHKEPSGSIAFAAATTTGKCTRWSSGGCGNLDGFNKPGDAESRQYRVAQIMQEVAFKWRGFAVQEEFHWKRVTDRVNRTTSNLTGSYAQIGYFFHDLIPIIPPNLELAFRYAFVDEPNVDNIALTNTREEFTGAINYFFAEHTNKLTLDASHLTLKDTFLNQRVSDERVRVQWDVSF